MDEVVIVGGGFGGLAAARALEGRPVSVTLVDRRDHHLFQPFLYQVATGQLEPQATTASLRGLVRDSDNLHLRVAHATGVDWTAGRVRVDRGRPVGFDHLILAAGATPNTLGIEGVREHCYPLKTLADAARLRDHVLEQLEQAAAATGPPADGRLRFVVVGAGPTGVELAGALADLVDDVLPRDYPELDPDAAEVIVVEALPHVLHAFSAPSRETAERSLRRRGVDVRVDTPLEEVADGQVALGDGTTLPADTIVWAAGVRAQTLADELGVEQTGGARVVVDDDLSVPAHPEAFVVGDLAGATDPDGNLYPQLAPVAVQQGRHAARQIAHRRAGRPTEPFRYRDKGIMATLGRGSAVAELPGGIRLTGRLGWLAWMGAHLLFHTGHRNRALVLLDWFYTHLLADRAARTTVHPGAAPRRTPGEDADRAAAE